MKCSIICNTYNHERFIRQALDSFLCQSVNFDYEILIHDDASTDNTMKIVDEYRKLYPSIIKPIYQTENQTQKGLSVSEINIARAKGEYIAICEGDDYWVDPNKLQKQVGFLDENKAFTCVVHASYKKNVNFPYKTKLWSFKNCDCIVNIEEIIKNRGVVFTYNSFVFRNEQEQYPVFFNDFKVADVKRLLFCALKGNVYYINRAMSVYQVGVNNSWTYRIRLKRDSIINHYLKEIKFYEAFNQYTNYRYSDLIDDVIDDLESNILIQKCDFSVNMKTYYNSLSYMRRMIIYLSMLFPNLFDFIKRMRYLYWV